MKYDPLTKKIEQYRVEMVHGKIWLKPISRETLEGDFVTDYRISHVVEGICNELEKKAKQMEDNKTPFAITLRIGVTQRFSEIFISSTTRVAQWVLYDTSVQVSSSLLIDVPHTLPI